MQKKSAIPDQEPQCSVDFAFQRIGGKYKGRIIFHLDLGITRYGALRRSIVGVTPKMLTQALRELEADGLITRHVFAEVPPRVEYALSEAGAELIPFIRLLRDWGEKQMEKQGKPSLSKLGLLPHILEEAHEETV
ncbi:winged helix-turn-helix transcriptional regulator [Deminuibacter soli]|uniref:Transcriptional regulator n=1 Tax=Deminuibacter soli TaxID=2291815 RepID=A0A3E1NNF5_9BACT|nr:helix-turn-helix domain-containing protein [Deminuibacter soli]RFM29469.1 transcriptional regulator [Deminuibacter soli]